MAADRTLLLKLVSDLGSIKKDTNALTSGLTKMGRTVVGLGAGLGIAVGLTEAIDVMGDAIDASSDLAEQQSKVGAVFGEQADDVRDWAHDLDSSFGITETAALTAAGEIGNLATAMGLTEDDAADMSRRITELAGDLSSFNNTPVDDVLGALQSGLIGESEPMRRFGVLLSDAAVQAEGLASGMVKAGQKMSDAQKVQARYNIILKQTKTAQGDAAKTADTYAGKQRQLAVSTNDLLVKMGDLMKGPATLFLDFLSGVVDVLDGDGGANESLLALADNMTKVKDAATDGLTAIQRSGREYQKAHDVVQQLEFSYAELAVSMVKALGDDTVAIMLENTGLTADAIFRMAQKVADAGGDFSDFQALIEQWTQSNVKGANILTNAWTGAMNTVETETVDTARTLDRWLGTLPKTVEVAVADMVFAVEGSEWKAAWERMAAWATDPFKPVGKRLAEMADRATRKAAQAAENGRPRVARKWRRIAASMRNPIVQAMVAVGVSVDEAVARLWTLRRAARATAGVPLIGNLLDLIVNFPPNSGGGGGGGGGHGRASVSSLAAGAGYGETSAGRAFLGSAAAQFGTGTTYNINVTGAIDPYAVGQQIVRSIKAYEAREGKRWRVVA